MEELKNIPKWLRAKTWNQLMDDLEAKDILSNHSKQVVFRHNNQEYYMLISTIKENALHELRNTRFTEEEVRQVDGYRYSIGFNNEEVKIHDSIFSKIIELSNIPTFRKPYAV